MFERPGQIRAKLSLLALASTLVLFFSGCSGERSQVRHHNQQLEVLDEVVDAYWHAIRWEYHDKAVAFIEDPDERSQLWEYLISRQGKAGVGDVTVYRIELDEEGTTATVSVHYQLMVKSEVSIREMKITQTWYLGDHNHWFLRLVPEELERLG